eukprot:183256-Chlamydomonas_euryale.AAC.1
MSVERLSTPNQPYKPDGMIKVCGPAWWDAACVLFTCRRCAARADWGGLKRSGMEWSGCTVVG